MPVGSVLNLNPLVRAISSPARRSLWRRCSWSKVAALTFIPLLVFCNAAQARDLINENLTIDHTTAPDSYRLVGTSVLTATGASTLGISADVGTSLDLGGTQVSGGAATGVALIGGATARIAAGSTVTSDRTALIVGETGGNGSTAIVSDSVLAGGTAGAVVSGLSSLVLNNSVVSGATSDGVQVFGGTLQATGGSITGGRNGLLLGDTAGSSNGSQVTLDGTHVEGLSGAAILVNNPGGNNESTINVRNGATLVGSNGLLLQVIDGAKANLDVSNSALVGDVVAEAGSTANVTLQNAATLTGRLQNVDTLTLSSQGKWIMVEDGELKNLAMSGGSVQFGQPGSFYTLSVENLSGNGNFIMHTDFATGRTDFLDITGTATGSHTLDVASSGADPLSDKQIHVVRAAAGDASFSLLNGRVDLGTFSYDLIKVGANDWYLDASSKVISPGTDSILSLFDASRTAWYGELSTLRSRMGEVRMNNGQTGGWMRAYGNRFDVSADSGMAYKQTQHGLSFGVDTPLPALGDGQWVVGLLGGYSRSDLQIKHGTTGEVDSYYIGSYATWLDADSGYYFDGVLKLNRFQNASSVSLSDGAKAKGNYATTGVGTTLEFGRHIKLDDGYFVEPYAQVAALAVQGKSYALDNGMTAHGDHGRSLLGTLGSTFGRDIDLGDGQVVQPYLKAAVVNEFVKRNDVRVNNTTFNNDLSGSRLALGGGATMKVSDKVQMHADLDYSHGNQVKQPWGVNLGVEYKW
ncbi:autotransporter outer membrane beta-barrel domain-containing protein [Pseudomonas sp. RHF3.3-3]|uniref:autotransporter outer membrane beta-barrel domain-containing protein n=1 Tax=Pseudomonas sp. RHF3.3-3 TaxID=3396624 RepID=UPI003A83F8DA